jgi:hypothetical protein
LSTLIFRRTFSQFTTGVSGTNTAENGVGVHGQSTIPSETGKGGIGVRGDSNAVGVWGEGKNWHGVVGASHSTIGGAGVFGSCDSGVGVFGESKLSHAVQGKSQSTNGTAGVSGEHLGAGPGIFGKSASGPAGFFEGDVTVTGGLKVRGVPLEPQQISALGQQVTGLQQQVTSLHQLVNNLQAQLASLQSKEATDVQGIAVSLATLAARVTNLGG